MHLSAGGNELRIGVDDGRRAQVQRIVQEVVLVLTQFVRDRYGSRVAVPVTDPPHRAGRVSPHPARDLTLGGFVGALVGLAAALVRAPRPEGRPLRPRPGEWDLSVLAERIEARAADFPDRADEWRMYLELLHGHARDAILPPGFDELVQDVYAPLLD